MRIRVVGSSRQGELPPGKGGCFFTKGAFTYTEMMVSLAILLVVSTGIISSHYFGLRMYEITRTRLGVNDSTRKSFNQLSEEIRTARSIAVGQGTLLNFDEADVNNPQQGNSIQIYPSTNSSVFVRYFRDAQDQQLKRVTESSSNASVVASSITNAVIFACEDFAGNVLTNRRGSYALGIRLQFEALPGSQVPVGPGNYYDFYQWQTKITRRAGE